MKPIQTLLFGMIFFMACRSGDIKIVDKHIDFSQNRIDMTRDYVREHYGLNTEDIEIVPKMIVLHWTETATFQEAYDIFKSEYLDRPGMVANAGNVNVSVQFIVDRDGTIYRLMPETYMARHVIGLNYISLGVENIGGVGGQDDLTDAQIEANTKLVRYLVNKYPTIKYLIGHYEYTLFENSPLWMEKDPDYRTQKTDPGARFMQAVRVNVADLKMQGPPAGE
jgi:beta-N-acetylhexosaminidase